MTDQSAVLVWLAYAIGSAEMVLHPVVFCISTLNILVLVSSRFLHPNLRIFLVCQSLAIAGFELGRFGLVLVNKFLGGDIFSPGLIGFQIEAKVTAVFRSSIPHAIVLERLVATLLFRKYERTQSPYIGIGCCLIFASLALISGFSNTQSWGVSFFSYFFQLISILLSLLEIMGFGLIKTLNQKKYDQHLNTAMADDYSLSVKYQLSENIRTSRQLMPVFLCHFLNNLLTAICFASIYYQIMGNSPRLNSLSFAVNFIAQSTLNAGIEITVITHHPMLKKKFLSLLVRHFCLLRNVRVTIAPTSVATAANPSANSQQPRDIRGGPLVNQLNTDVHFRMLEAEWR